MRARLVIRAKHTGAENGPCLLRHADLVFRFVPYGAAFEAAEAEHDWDLGLLSLHDCCFASAYYSFSLRDFNLLWLLCRASGGMQVWLI